MKLSALLLAAAATTALAPTALAQTTTSTTTTSTSKTTGAARGAAASAPQSAPGPVNPPPQTMQPSTMAPGGMNTTGNTTESMDTSGAPTSGGAFQPLPATSSQDIVATLQASGQFGTFLRIADATGLTPVLKTTPGITVFAPTDAAFAAMPPAAMDLKDQANLQKLQTLLTYHLVNAKVPPLTGHGATPVATVAGPKVILDGTGPNVKINNANALQTQVTASNGVIYPIDKVLSPDYAPPPAAAAPEEKTTTTTTKTKKKATRKHH